MNAASSPRLVITSGEPAGIGPDLCVHLSRQHMDAQLIVIGDVALLRQRAEQLNTALHINPVTGLDSSVAAQSPGTLNVYHIDVAAQASAGQLNPVNARYVLQMLDLAVDACLRGDCQAMVTGPVHKGVINEAGIPFTGHTEYLARRCAAPLPVMLLQTEGLRVALATTHLPLREVSQAITRPLLTQVIDILHHDLVTKYGIPDPVIMVCGLNPHAGEGGHLGNEEQRVIEPVIRTLCARGMRLIGPLPADTIFSPDNLQRADAFLAMYHDQGLPVLKYRGFGRAINVTLGLPLLRTSVDHGTALDLAGTGRIDDSSFLLAIRSALALTSHHHS